MNHPNPTPQAPFWTRVAKRPSTWFALVGAIAIGTVTMQVRAGAHLFDQGEAAYSSQDCDAAIALFDQLIENQPPMDMDDWIRRAEARKAECGAFQTVMADQNSQSEAQTLVDVSQFLERYPNTELAIPLRKLITTADDGEAMTALSTVEVCDRLPTITTQRLMLNADTQLPLMLQSCGNVYSEQENFDQAIAVYTQFGEQYPDHEQASVVEAALAKTMVAQANTFNPGTIPPPPVSGYTGDGTTVVTIRNDSPEAMRIVLSGEVPQFQELPPCTDCTSFVGDAPSSCPEKGPEATFVLDPGQYDVLVRSTSGSYVTPFTGKWNLNPGHEYYNCFYLVQTPGVS